MAEELLNSTSLDTVCASLCYALGVDPPNAAADRNSLFSEYIDRKAGTRKFDRIFMYHPDAIAQWILEKYPYLFGEAVSVKSLLFCKKPSGDWYVPTVLAPCDGWFGNAGALCNRPPLLPLDVRPHVEVLPVSRPCLVLLHQ